MSLLDWSIVGIYLIVVLLIGLYFTRRASKSIDDFFVAGRSLSWFIAGTSIVATTFSTDTPLVVAGISRDSGVSGHWFWLSAAIGQTATIFFFARLWRRTHANTDLEFIAHRYKPSLATSILRLFKVFFDGVLLNCLVMGSVILAMTKIINAILVLPEGAVFELPIVGAIGWTGIILFVLGLVSVLYSSLSGLYGVVYTDLIQFILALIGSIGLAAIVYVKGCNDGNIIVNFAKVTNSSKDYLSFVPSMNSSLLAFFTFFTYIFMTWWYRVPGNGYYVQRILATKSEKDSFLAFLWFNICQYVIRPWPWIIVGLLSLYYLPDLKDSESSFPEMIMKFLPDGIKGIMVAAMLAAFMSTIDTHLNWGTSYIVNDLYKPYICKNKEGKHPILLSRILVFVFMIIAILIATRLKSILGAYKYISVVFGGISTVMIARWYWWRVNPFSEISGIIASLIVANFLQFVLPSTKEHDLYAIRLIITVVIVTSVWIVVTLVTGKKQPSKHLIDFYKKMRIPGPGWKKIRLLAKMELEKSELKYNFLGWLCCVLFIYSTTLCIGKLLFQSYLSALVCMVLSFISGYVLIKIFKKMNIFSS